MSLAGFSNRLVFTCFYLYIFFLHQKAAVTLLLCSPASADTPEEAPLTRSDASACPAWKPRGHATGRSTGRHLDSSPAPAQGLISKPGVLQIFLLKPRLLPAVLFLLLSAVSRLLLLSGSIVPNPLRAQLYLQLRSFWLKSPGGFGGVLIKPCGRWSHFTALVIGALLKRIQTLRPASGDKMNRKVSSSLGVPISVCRDFSRREKAVVYRVLL